MFGEQDTVEMSPPEELLEEPLHHIVNHKFRIFHATSCHPISTLTSLYLFHSFYHAVEQLRLFSLITRP